MDCLCIMTPFPATAMPPTCPLHGQDGHTWYIWEGSVQRVIFKDGKYVESK
jgi:hypothetical protein